MAEPNPGTAEVHVARAESWSRYWATPVRHSCPGSFARHYGPATQAFWRRHLITLDRHDRVVELGCGNGSLVRFMAESGAPVPSRVDLVDIAAVDGSWIANLPRELAAVVTLHHRTPAQALPVPTASVTRIHSQYALEYFWSAETWKELQRIMAPRASIAAVIHHHDSLLTRNARVERSHCDWLLSAYGPMEQLEAVLPIAVSAAATGGRERLAQDERALEIRASFNAVFLELERRAAATPPGDLLIDFAQAGMRALHDAAVHGPAVGSARLQGLRQNARDHRLRVDELAASALDRGGLDAWCRELSEAGMQVETGELSEQGELFGWTIAGRR